MFDQEGQQIKLPRLPGEDRGLEPLERSSRRLCHWSVVDSYHEFREYEMMMQAVFRALKPGGRLVIIDGEAPSGKPRTAYHSLYPIPKVLIREEVIRQGFLYKESRPGFYES